MREPLRPTWSNKSSMRGIQKGSEMVTELSFLKSMHSRMFPSSLQTGTYGEDQGPFPGSIMSPFNKSSISSFTLAHHVGHNQYGME